MLSLNHYDCQSQFQFDVKSDAHQDPLRVQASSDTSSKLSPALSAHLAACKFLMVTCDKCQRGCKGIENWPGSWNSVFPFLIHIPWFSHLYFP